MSECLVPTILGVQAGGATKRHLPESMVSGCTEHSLVEGGGVDAPEYVITKS